VQLLKGYSDRVRERLQCDALLDPLIPNAIRYEQVNFLRSLATSRGTLLAFFVIASRSNVRKELISLPSASASNSPWSPGSTSEAAGSSLADISLTSGIQKYTAWSADVSGPGMKQPSEWPNDAFPH